MYVCISFPIDARAHVTGALAFFFASVRVTHITCSSFDANERATSPHIHIHITTDVYEFYIFPARLSVLYSFSPSVSLLPATVKDYIRSGVFSWVTAPYVI